MSTSNDAHNGAIEDDRIYSFAFCADKADVSLATFRRLVSAGTGPKVTDVSDRRRGVRGKNYRAWLDSRTVSKPEVQLPPAKPPPLPKPIIADMPPLVDTPARRGRGRPRKAAEPDRLETP
jgi:hypothetical protein